MADFRVLLYRQDGTPEGELSKDAGTLLSCTRSEEINGEHSLTLTTERHMEVGTRALTHHSDGRWREWVVDEPGETHDNGNHAIGTYHLCWSLQYDLQTVYGQIRELGMLNSANARNGLAAALDGTTRWKVGTCDVTTNVYSVVMDEESSAWDRLTTVVKYWGGEIDVDITVDPTKGVTSRKVCLYKHLGSTVASRRFEWGFNLTSITRTPDPGPYVCRMVPLGNGETEEAADGVTTYDVKLDITNAASFVDSSQGIRHERGTRYIRDTQSEAVFRVPDGSGGWEYPTTVVSFSTDELDELVSMAKQDVLSHTRPGISYTGSVANFARAGLDTDGICLGDEVQIIDLGFNPNAPLRVQERILQIEIDEMGKDDAQLSIGRLIPKLERTLATVTKTVGTKNVAYNAPVWDGSKYTVDTPDLSHYTVEPISGAGDSYEVPSVDYDIADYGSAIADLQTQVSDIYSGGGSGGGTIGGDAIKHAVNGAVITEGTINFTTVGSGSSSSSDSSSDDERVPFAPEGWGKTSGMGRSKVFPSSSWGSGS